MGQERQNRGEDLIARLTRLRQYGKSGIRAPHKPLLALLALSRLAATGSSRLGFSEVESQLADLIGEYGPTSSTGRRQAAAYPFTHLRSDDVWELDADVPMDRVGPVAGVTGRLVPDLEQALIQHPDRLMQVARALVDAQFPPSLADEVLAAVGLDPEDATLPGTGGQQPSGRRRSAAWRSDVLADWDNACAFCGYDGSLRGVPVGVEAAHVRWFDFDGPDDPDNGLALCSLHHKLLDRGALGLTPDHRIVVSRSYSARTPAGRLTYDLHGKPLNPRPGTVLPSERHIAWHRVQVFHEPAVLAG